MTANQKQFRKLEMKFIKKLKGIQKRGFILPEIPEEFILPKSGRVTKSRLQKIETLLKGSNIYSRLEYIEPITGEVLTGVQGRKLERKKAAAKAQKTKEYKKFEKETERTMSDVIISNFLKQCDLLFRGKAREYYYESENALYRLIEEYGKDKVANAMQNMPYTLASYVSSEGYGYDVALNYISLVGEMLFGYKSDLETYADQESYNDYDIVWGE